MKNVLKIKYISLFLICFLQSSKSFDFTIRIINQVPYNMKGQFAINKNGDMIIEYSSDKSRTFYGMKKMEKVFLMGNIQK